MFVDRPVGIDLGTTNSEIAMLLPSERDIYLYADRFGRKTIPSAVAWDPGASAFVVGHAARARRAASEHLPVESIKRRMGQAIRVAIGPEQLTPEAVSAQIIQELRDRMRADLTSKAEEGVEMHVSRGVITVPAYFDAPQVEATRRAGELAGLSVLGVLQEPTAAAIHCTWKRKLGDGTFLVYDLGGGTFDVSILRSIGGEYQVLAVDGDNFLGGDDLDRRFAEWLRKELALRGYAMALDVRDDAGDRARFARLFHLAQEVKESLSTTDVVHVSKQELLEDQFGRTVSFVGEIGRAEYESRIADLVENTIACSLRAVERSKATAGIDLAQIDHVILVGGSTRVPLVTRRVTEALASKTKNPTPLQDDVDTCVALGAAIYAAQIGGLRLGDDSQEACVAFTTPLAGRGERLRLGVRVEQAPAGASALRIDGGDGESLAAPAALAGDDVLRFDVPLSDAPERAATLVFQDADANPLAELPFALYRGDARPRSSALSRPSVVAKDIALDVVRAGRRERKVLLPSGTGLPARVTHELYTVDQSGTVVLRLLQNRLPIKTLAVEVPRETPIGTRVELTVSCDASMRMEARALVAGQELWAQIEAPRLERFDRSDAIDRLLEEAERAGRALWGAYGHAYRREHDRLVSAIRELMTVDPDKCEALCHRLRQLIDEFSGGDGATLTPPMHHFEDALDALRRVVYRADAPLVGMGRDAWEARIARLDEEARAAYDASDGPRWRRLCNEAQALLETSFQEELSATDHDAPAYVARRYTSVLAFASRLTNELDDFVPAAAAEVREAQLAERERLLAWLSDRCKGPLAALETEGLEAPEDVRKVRRALEQIAAELERIQAAIERIPAIGLVTDRGAQS